MISWDIVIFYIISIISSLLIMMGLLFLISSKIKNKIYGVLFLSMGIGIISLLIVYILIIIRYFI